MAVEHIKAGALSSMGHLKETNCCNILTDNRQTMGSFNKANEWLVSKWLPKAMTNGMKNYVLITPPNLFTGLSAKELETKLEVHGFDMHCFKDYEEAKNWMRVQINPCAGKAA